MIIYNLLYIYYNHIYTYTKVQFPDELLRNSTHPLSRLLLLHVTGSHVFYLKTVLLSLLLQFN